jgi:hypothetical protein
MRIRMTPHALLVLSLLMLTLTSVARAEPVPIGTEAIQPGLVVKRDGKELKNAPILFVTKFDCDRNASYEFLVKYVSAVPLVEAWVGIGALNCAEASNRTRSHISTAPPCKLVAISANATATQSLTINAAELFSRELGPADETVGAAVGAESCDAVVNQSYTLFLLPLSQRSDLAANVAYAPLIDPPGVRSATFTLFNSQPDPPPNVSPRAGVAQIGVAFERVANEVPATRYRAYFDWGNDEDQECGSGALVAGETAPLESATIEGVWTSTRVATLTSLDEKGIPPGTKVAVAVTTVDPAGNESLLSAPVCAERPPDSEFIEEPESGSCRLAASHSRPAKVPFGLGTAFFSALVLLLRRSSARARTRALRLRP